MLVSEFSNILYRNANDNSQTDCLLINFSEAFDRVAHCCLIENLSWLNTDSLIKESVFLQFRKQFMVIKGTSPHITDVSSCVP